jgi:hypothetical protein
MDTAAAITAFNCYKRKNQKLNVNCESEGVIASNELQYPASNSSTLLN